MDGTSRRLAEQRFHDTQALARRSAWRDRPSLLLVNEDSYLGHETWIEPALAALGDVRGKRVLDLGCGHGMASVVLARRGARVVALELSAWYLVEARERARANGLGGAIHFVQASGEQLPFANRSLDCIWGNAILHHLDLDQAGAELARVLAPGGKAVFAEPWGENPLLEWARRRRGSSRTPDERPLRRRDVKRLTAHFAAAEVTPHQVLGSARRLWPGAPFLPFLDRVDQVLLGRSKGLPRWCRYVVLSLRK